MRDYLKTTILVVALIGAFLAGSASVEYCAFPYRYGIRPAVLELSRLLKDSPTGQNFLWYPSDYTEKGVKKNSAEERYGEFTFFCLRDRPEARLINSQGKIVHRWRKPYREIWPDRMDSESDSSPGWIGCHLNPETGQILAYYNGWPETFQYRGLVKLTRNAEVIWRYDGHVHHDIERLPNGHWLVLTYETRRPPERLASGETCCDYSPRIIDERVVELDEQGRPVDSFSLIDSLDKSLFMKSLMRRSAGYPSFDLLHVNNVEYVSRDFARHHSELDKGDLIFSARNIDTIFGVAADTRNVNMVKKGVWRGQHDPDLLPSGRILLFDNRGGSTGGGESRILEFDPRTYEITWAYRGTKSKPFTSKKLGEQTRLANGNTLISEARRGRIFEVTPDKEIVWSYIYPDRKMIEGDEYIGTFGFGTDRFKREKLDFLDKPSQSQEAPTGG